MPVLEGRMEGNPVSVLRDTGCSTVVVRRSLVKDSQLTGKETLCILIDGTVRRTPVAEIEIETPYLTGKVTAVCMKQPLYDLIIGNVDGVKQPCSVTENSAAAVETRNQQKTKHLIKPLKVPAEIETELTKDELHHMQVEDKSLEKAWGKAREQENLDLRSRQFGVENGLLYRREEQYQKQTIKQLVLPEPLRARVMKLAHEAIMSGHQGIRRTVDRVRSNFWWPGMQGDITRYCRSCDICQRTVAKGRTAKIPLGNVPIIDVPFKRVAIDLVGPMFPATDRGNRYLLTLVDYATRYPEAVVLKNVETETVAEALVSIFTRVGVPMEVLSDQGGQFMSGVFKEVSRLLSMKQLTTTPYHPQCNGLVEKLNGSLKTMLKRMCAERPKDWDRYVDPLLFAYREVPQESLGYSPFEMLYGRSVRGPMNILKELWTGEQEAPDVKLSYQYAIDLRERLQDTWELAHQQLAKAQIKQKKQFDCKTRERSFQPGDKVLLLLPTDANKLLMHWKGPFEVLERVNGKDYRIQLPGRVRMFHANLLKRYWERENDPVTTQATGAAIIEPQEETDETPLETLQSQSNETYQDVKISPTLTEEQRTQVKN